MKYLQPFDRAVALKVHRIAHMVASELMAERMITYIIPCADTLSWTQV